MLAFSTRLNQALKLQEDKRLMEEYNEAQKANSIKFFLEGVEACRYVVKNSLISCEINFPNSMSGEEYKMKMVDIHKWMKNDSVGEVYMFSRASFLSNQRYIDMTDDEIIQNVFEPSDEDSDQNDFQLEDLLDDDGNNDKYKYHGRYFMFFELPTEATYFKLTFGGQ